MATLPYVPGVLRADLLWADGHDVNMLTRLHFAYTGGPPSGADCVSIASGIRTAAATAFADLLNTDGVIRGVDVIDLSGEEAATGTDLTVTSGTLQGHPLPAGTALLINHAIARRYRGDKPRSYMPLFTAEQLNNPSEWNAASVQSFETTFASFVAAVGQIVAGSTQIGGHVNVSYYSGYGTPRPRSNGHLYYPPGVRATPKVDPITASTLNIRPGAQRRRNLHSS